MPIANVPQPPVLAVDENLRLRRFEGPCDFAFAWYQDPETVWLVDGKREPYTVETLHRMYRYLNDHGELYFIEILEEGRWKPIGDVTFCQEDIPIVVGDRACRGKHIGRRVLATLIQRARELGYSRLCVNEIYDYNIGSRKCFESLGFRACEKTARGSRFYLNL